MTKYAWAVFFLTAFIFTASAVGKVSADAGCVPVYGGGVQCPRAGQVLINKTVRNPSTGVFVDNLGLNDPKYRPLQTVIFHITVQNSGDQNLDTVKVADKIPQFLDFMSGPGSYDPSSRVLTFTASNLVGGTSQTFEVKGRVVAASVLPPEKSVVCPVNIADAVSGSQSDHDESQFCIEKQLVVPAVPKAGPEHWLATLGIFGSALIAGLYLRKRSYTS